jgi:hypothetical protein
MFIYWYWSINLWLLVYSELHHKKKMKTIVRYLFITACLLPSELMAQNNVAINITGLAADASAMVDISSASTGLLVPRMALSARNVAAPVTTPAQSLLIFNTATAGAGTNAVTPGYYYWDSGTSTWMRLLNQTNAWNTNGNFGTTASTAAIGAAANNHFIGTNDNVDFVMITNGLERLRIEDDGDVGIGVQNPTEQLEVDGFYKGGILAMGMDCSYEGTNASEHNDFGCLICVVRSADGNLYCRSSVDDQEELDQLATTPALWNSWTNYGNPGPGGTYIEAVDVFIESTNNNDDCTNCCGANNDWAGAITIRLSNGNVYMRATTSVNGSTNSADACVTEIGSSPGRYSAWTNLGQP